MIRKSTPTFLLFLFIAADIQAQTHTSPDSLHYWKSSGIAELAFNQAALSNWQGGGQNTIAGSGFLHAFAKYKRGPNQWDNKLEAAFGIARIGDASQPFIKSDDGLEISSIYGRSLADSVTPSHPWSIAVGGDFTTTFAPGYKYGKDINGKTVQQKLLSNFMSPAYLLISAGIKYEIKDAFYAMLAPVAVRMTFLSNDSMAMAGAYGVTPGHHLRVQVGESFTLGMKIPVMQNVVFETHLSLFGDYRHVQQQVVDWTAALTCKVNSLITANVSTHLFYDQDIAITRDNGTVGPAVQFKEVITLGIQYKLY